MARKFLVPIDMNQNEVQNPRAQNLAARPSSPVAGQWFFNTSSNVVEYWDGSAWVSLHDDWIAAVGVSAPITSTGGASPTIGISAATAGAAGSMSAADKSKLDAATSANTVSAILMRDGSGNAALNVLTAAQVTGLSAPSGGTDAVNKNYVDNLIQGNDWKSSVRAATAATLPAYTRAGNVLTANANGSINSVGIDGITDFGLDQRVLLKNGAAGADNGIYFFSALGAAGAPWSLTRATDADSSADVTSQMVVPVSEGTANGGTLFRLVTDDPIVLNTTALTFELIPGSLAYTEGTGIDITGNVISIDAAYVGQTSITTLGTITTGVWNGTAIPVANGGTGATTAPNARTNLNAAGKYTALIGDNSATSIPVTQATHGLAANGSLIAAIYDASTGAEVNCDISINNANGTVTFAFSAAPATNAYRIVILG